MQEFGQQPIDLSSIGEELLAELSPDVEAANRTLLVTATTSFHMFATNRTEPCHYHPGETLQRVLHGGGQFYVPYGHAVPQAVGDSFFIPRGLAHSFDGQLHGPSLVLVRWTPPYHEPYVIPTTGCIFDSDE
jgi:mannose-6-phosphate isomerase-like protein (cupin superfamily)